MRCKLELLDNNRSVKPLIFLFLLLVFLRPALALDLCDDEYDRPDFDSHSPSPDLSHNIFGQSRWRCVTRTFADGEMLSSIEPFASFSEALGQCSEAAEQASSPSGDAYEFMLGLADANVEMIEANGRLFANITKERACTLWDADELPTTDSYVGHYEFKVQGPATWRLYEGMLDGESVKNAGLILWEPSGPNLKAYSVEYTPEHRVSRCQDPVCTGGGTDAVQYGFGSIEPGHGTVDVEVPLFSQEYPGLVPLSLHYSSWNIVKRTQGKGINAIEPFMDPVEEKPVGMFWFWSWHHSYDKRITEDYLGDGVVLSPSSPEEPVQIYLHLPSEDVLIFEKDGETWANVSHPGVLTRIRLLGSDNGYEVFHPSGYTERYDRFGHLMEIHYPSGRSLSFTPFLDERSRLFAIKIEQTNPSAGVVIAAELTGQLRQIYDLNNPDYEFFFDYQEPDNEISKPRLTSITRPDGTVLQVDQEQLALRDGQPPIDHGYFLLKGLEIDGRRLMDIDYQNDGRARSIKYLGGESLTAQYSPASQTNTSSYGASYSLSLSDQQIGESVYFGQTTIPSLMSADCPECGYSETYGYDNQGLIATVGRSGTLPFNAEFTKGLLDRFSYGTQSTDFQWDTSKQQLQAIAGTGVLNTQLSRGADGLLTQVASGSGDKVRSVQVDRGNGGKPTRLSATGNDRLEIGYTERGFISSLRGGLGFGYQFLEHNHLGQPQRLIDPNGVKSELNYDVLGRLTQYQSDTGDSLSLAYNSVGQPVSATSNGRTLDFEYDEQQRLVGLRAGTCEPSLSYQYDTSGLLIRESVSHNGVQVTTSYEHGAEGRVRAATSHYASGPVRTEFNARGQVTQKVDGDNIRRFHYDGNGRLQYFTGTDNRPTNFSYGELGRLMEAAASGGRVTQFDYTPLGQLSGQYNVNWGLRSYQYDDAHRLHGRQTPQYTTTYGYDDGDRPDTVVHRRKDDSKPPVAATYGYDDTSVRDGVRNYGVGRLTKLENDFSRYRFRYNARGKLIEQGTIIPSRSVSKEAQTRYKYNSNQQLVEVEYSSGDRLRYERASCGGHVTEIYWNDTRLAALDYSSRIHPHTQARLSNGLVMKRAFDDRHRLTDIRIESNGDSTPLWGRTYEYDSHSNLVSSQPPETAFGSATFGGETFQYDNANRLTKARGPYGTLNYQYDDRDRRTLFTSNDESIQYQYADGKDQLVGRFNAAGQLIQDYTHDADGHQTRGGDWNYQYDAAGRLTDVYRGGQWIASYEYDANGKRVSKQTNEGSLYFHYDLQGRLLEETDQNGEPVRQYLYTGDGDLLGVVVEGQPYFVHRDQRGAPQRLTDAAGAIVWEAEYTPFGSAMVDSNADIELPLRLLGQYYDSETGLHYNQQRYYDPDTGQYLQVDPLGLAGGFELYNYALQNPYRYVDPEGEFVFTASMVVITGVSWALTAWDVYETVDGLASGDVTAEDIAGQYGRDKAIDIGLRALPGVGAVASLLRRGGGQLGVINITGHTRTLRNPSQIDQIKKDMLDGGYRYNSPEGIISGVLDEKGVLHVGDGQHRVNAALEIFEETGSSKPLNRLIDSAKKGVNGRSYLPTGNPSWKTNKLPRRNSRSWWRFW